MTNKEKFLQLVSNEDQGTLDRAKARRKNRSNLKLSQQIALTILERLDKLGWTQRKLAEEMGVTPQMVNKWVKGNEEFGTKTIAKLQDVMQFTILKVGEERKPQRKWTHDSLKFRYQKQQAVNPLCSIIITDQFKSAFKEYFEYLASGNEEISRLLFDALSHKAPDTFFLKTWNNNCFFNEEMESPKTQAYQHKVSYGKSQKEGKEFSIG